MSNPILEFSIEVPELMSTAVFPSLCCSRGKNDPPKVQACERLEGIRAIIAKPDLIFFDEPTTGLDPITADAVNNLIVEQVKALGAAAVSITHDMASVRKIADEVAMLHEGRIVWRGPVGALDRSGSPYIDQFVNGRAEGPIQPAI